MPRVEPSAACHCFYRLSLPLLAADNVAYTIDGLSRVMRALESVTGGSSTRDEQWTLTQTGNWSRRKLDLNADSDFTDADELDDCGTFNKANEWTARDTDCNASTNYTLTYDEAGNLTDDGKDWKFVYDPFGRLRKIKNQSNTLVEEFTYNGLGYRVGWHYDVDADTDVDANDVWFHFAYDDAWRIVAAFRSSDTNAKELFVAHMAGANGRGGSSALDAVILRDKDANSSWGSAMDGTREERAYYCQNWRGDVVAMLKATGGTNCQVYETLRYSSYGVPFGITPGDIEGDGDVVDDDNTNWPGSYQVRCDYDLDGDMDTTDQNFTISNWGRSLGRGVLSHSSVANRKGYCGYEHDAVIDTMAHVRHRVLITELGRWSSRDPIDYIDGRNLYDLVAGRVHQFVDPYGLQRVPTDDWTPRMRYLNGHSPGFMCSVIDEWLITCDGVSIEPRDACGGSPPCPLDPRFALSADDWGYIWTSRGNCYRYAASKALPFGQAWGHPNHQETPGPDDQHPNIWTCETFKQLLLIDGIYQGARASCPRCSYEVKGVVRGDGLDFHFYRINPGARQWSDKRGNDAVREQLPSTTMGEGTPGGSWTQYILDGYAFDCGTFCVPYSLANIDH